MPIRTSLDLLKEHGAAPTRGGSRFAVAQIGPWTLYLNPHSFRLVTSRVHLTVQTADGYGRFSYGNTPNTYTLEGTTGNAGVHGAGGIADLDQLRPQPGRADKSYPFLFPVRFSGVRYVKVNQIADMQDAAESPYFHNYTIELEEFYKTIRSPAMRVGGQGFPPLPAGGN